MQGVYGIKIGNKWYIGSSSNLEERIKQHKLSIEGGYHENKEMQKEYDLIGKYEISVIESIDKKSILLYKESYYMGLHNSINNGFNKILPRSFNSGVTTSDILKVICEHCDNITNRINGSSYKNIKNCIYSKKQAKEIKNKVAKLLTGED